MKTVDTISFNAKVTDNLGVDSVYVEYRVNDQQSKYIGLKAGNSDAFKAIILGKSLILHGGDSLKYRIFATDSAHFPNIAVLPVKGYFAVKIEEISNTLTNYSTNFVSASSDFFNIGFDISKPAGFVNYGLHTKHPYESPEDNNKSINYYSLLRHPIIFSEAGMIINFNEVVLVEPGEPGSVFGGEDFYDYVVLEGSKNFGKTWFGLTDGWDSRLVPAWESAYNNSIVGQNSTIPGNESMLNKHTIFYRPSDKISAGDTVLLRFRLFLRSFCKRVGVAY